MTFSHIKSRFSKQLPDSAPASAFAQKAAPVSTRPAHTSRTASRTVIARIALIAFLVLPFLFASCSNLFNDVSSSINNHNSSDNANNSQNREVVITGGISVDSSKVNGAVPSEMAYFGDVNATNKGRFAIPTLANTTNATYIVSATAPGYSGTRTGTAANGTFSIPLALGYKWTITLEMKTPNADNSVTTKLKGTYTYSSNLSDSNALDPVSITLAPIANGTGSIDLYVASDYQPEIVVNHKPQGAVWENPSASKVEGSNQYRISTTGIKSGVYDITLVFKNGNSIVYSYDQAINVFDNMITNTWIGDGTSNSPINGNSFEVTQDLIKSYARTNFYVSTSGNDTTGDGSSFAPYATVSKVLSVIGSGESGCNYVIRLMNDIQERVLISTLTAGTLTIKGYGANRTIKNNVTDSSDVGNYTVKVQTQPLVTLENITIDGAVTYPTGTGVTMGLVAERYTNVTLKNCTITKTNRENGNAIWSKGTVTLEDCTITHCRSTDVDDTEKSYLIVNSEYGVLNLKNCTISGNTARCIIYNVSSAVQLKLDGNISIPVTNTGDQRVSIKLEGTSTGSKITVGDAFTSSGSILLELHSYTPGNPVLVPETDGATSVVANAASHFTLTDANYAIGTSGENVGKLVLNPNIYVSSTASAGGNGSAASPYATIAEALNKIKTLSANSPADYVINISGIINEAITLSTDTETGLGAFSGSTLTILGTDKDQAKINVTGLNDPPLISVSSGLTVNLENLTLKGSAGSTTGVYVNNSSANVTITNCDIINNRIGVIVNTGNVTVEGCSISGNINGASEAYGGGINNKGTLTLKSIGTNACNITGNRVNTLGKGGGVYNTGTLNIEGEVIIKDNKCGTTTDYTYNNLYLTSGHIINVTAALGSNCDIRISTHADQTLNAQIPLKLTNGYSTYKGDTTAANFKSDAGLAIMEGTDDNAGELVLAKSGGNIDTPLDYIVTLSCSNTTIVAPGSVIKVDAAVKKDGTALSPEASDITWSFNLLCANDILATIPSEQYPATYITTGAGYASVTIPTTIEINKGGVSLPYTLHASATYKDAPAKDIDIALTGSTLGFVIVAGTTVATSVTNGTLSSDVFNGSSVKIRNLYASDHEVTQAEFAAVMGTNPSAGSSNPAAGETQANRPVEQVSWYDAIAYCNKLSIKDGLTPCYTISGVDWANLAYNDIPHRDDGSDYNDSTWDAVQCNFNVNGYRLPEDAEWEYLARGGSTLSNAKYSGTDDNTAVYDYAWFYENSNSDESSRKTHEVKKKLPNSLGIYDMSGNVSEWCWDNNGNGYRLDRGAHWNHNANNQYARDIYTNYSNSPGKRNINDLGFRVVRTAP